MPANIKRKIKALLNRTVENGATQGEAMNSMKLANDLMVKYMIERHQIQDGDEEIHCKSTQVKLKRKNKCINMLCGYLANTFGCEYIYTRITGTFFGFPVDVDICVYLYDLIFNALENEIKIFKKTSRFKHISINNNGRVLISDFTQGYCNALIKRLILLKAEKEQQIKTATGTDLVLHKDNIVKEELFKSHPEVRIAKPTKQREVQTSCYLDGLTKGESLQLNKGIASTDMAIIN